MGSEALSVSRSRPNSGHGRLWLSRERPSWIEISIPWTACRSLPAPIPALLPASTFCYLRLTTRVRSFSLSAPFVEPLSALARRFASRLLLSVVAGCSPKPAFHVARSLLFSFLSAAHYARSFTASSCPMSHSPARFLFVLHVVAFRSPLSAARSAWPLPTPRVSRRFVPSAPACYLLPTTRGRFLLPAVRCLTPQPACCFTTCCRVPLPAVCFAFRLLLSIFCSFAAHSPLIASLPALRAIFCTAFTPARGFAPRSLLSVGRCLLRGPLRALPTSVGRFPPSAAACYLLPTTRVRFLVPAV